MWRGMACLLRYNIFNADESRALLTFIINDTLVKVRPEMSAEMMRLNVARTIRSE
jgi:hypothetical protein